MCPEYSCEAGRGRREASRVDKACRRETLSSVEMSAGDSAADFAFEPSPESRCRSSTALTTSPAPLPL